MSYRHQKGIPGLYGGDARGLYGSRSYGVRNTMIYGKPPTPRWPKIVIAALLVLVVILCIRQFACGGIIPKGNDQQQQQEQVQEQTQEQQQEAAQQESEQPTTSGVTGTVTISAVGDCTLGTDINLPGDTNFTKIYKKNNDAYFFKRVKSYLESDDITIANLEGALTNKTERQDKGEGSFNFRGPTKYANILTEGSVEVCNLANNHSFDYGSDGYADTKKALDKQKIGYFCADLIYVKEVNGIKIGFMGINATAGYDSATSTMKNDAKALEEEGCDLIIGVFHWGVEGDYKVESKQVKLAHAAVDAGCNLVLGGHPHLLQGVESYKDANIVYSLGNFVFGGNDDPMDYETMIYQQTFSFENGQLVADATASSAQVIPCRLSTSKKVNNYQPMAVSGAEGTKIVKNVNKRSSALKGTAVQFSTELGDDNVAKVVQENQG